MMLGGQTVALAQPDSSQDVLSLFYSPTERARIEQQRKGVMDETEGESPQSGASRQIQFNGWVERKEGRGTIWINQRPWLEGTQEIPGYPSHLDRKDFRLRIDGRALRVGETLDLESRTQTDLIPAGAVTMTKRSMPVQKK